MLQYLPSHLSLNSGTYPSDSSSLRLVALVQAAHSVESIVLGKVIGIIGGSVELTENLRRRICNGGNFEGSYAFLRYIEIHKLYGEEEELGSKGNLINIFQLLKQ